MTVNRTPEISFARKIAAVRDCLRKKASLRKIAARLGVSHPAVWHWVKSYRTGGAESLKTSRRRTRKFPAAVEEQVMLLKERAPGMSIKNAQRILGRGGINISTYGIWRIWKEFGLIHRDPDNPLSLFCRPGAATRRTLTEVRALIGRRDFAPAARHLNQLAGIPHFNPLAAVPEKFLNVPRVRDRFFIEQSSLPADQVARKARRISRLLVRAGFVYSSILVDFIQLNALDTLGRLEQKMIILRRLEKNMRGVRQYALRFLLSFEKAYTAIYLLRVADAFRAVDRCRRLIYFLRRPYYWVLFANLLVHAGKFRNAARYYRLAYRRAPSDQIRLQLARHVYCYAGDYPDCRKMLGRIRAARRGEMFASSVDLTYAAVSYGQGDLARAAEYFVKSLSSAHQGQHRNRIYAASVGLASVAMALNNPAEARAYLEKYLPLMKKNHLRRESLLLACFLDPRTRIPRSLLKISTFRLIEELQRAKKTMRTGDFRRAQRFARKKGLTGFFHRCTVFYPEPVLRLIEKGVRTKIPRPILNFPLFNQTIPVYHIKLLSRFAVAKNQVHHNARFDPKERAFLIQLALKADGPGKYIAVSALCENFWPGSSNPKSRLSHLLLNIKKKLRLASHRLLISSKSGEPRLVNNGVYFTTDYRELKSLLNQANALDLSSEWHYARREYLRAFGMCQCAPFDKMYDNWSDSARRQILAEIESSAAAFARRSRIHGNDRAAIRVLGKLAPFLQAAGTQNAE